MQNRNIIFIFILSTILCGCVSEYNLATGREEALFYSTDKEISLGRSISKQVEKKFKLLHNMSARQRVEVIGQKIAAICDRKDLVYYFRVLDEEGVNAISLPGGYIYLNKGLLDVATDDELACVIAHEIGHIVARHSMKKLQTSMGYMLGMILAHQTKGTKDAVRGADLAFGQIMLGYSRQDELLADKVGVVYAGRAGFKPRAMISFLNKLKEIKRKKPLGPLSYNRTHPYIADRIVAVKQGLGEDISFTEYINVQKE